MNLEHFNRHVALPDENGCRLWTGTTTTKGYGQFSGQRGPAGRRKYGAHRLAWELAHGPVPDGLFVCHRCDVRRCVNIDHLFLGTHADNVKDMIEKGRSNRGTKQWLSKLDDDAVTEIRRRYVAGESQACIAESFGIQQNTVSRIVHRRAWAHVSESTP